jgi:pimeloyl-ACP methyl ester carboxylesterase
MRALLLLPLLAVLLLALVWALQRRLIYLPMDHDVPPARALLPTAQEVVLRTTDGLALGAWLVEPAEPAWGAVLVFNGNAGHRGYRAPLADALSRSGLAVLLLDYRGYGTNPGTPSERGLRLDADAAAAFLAARGYPPERLVYFGESLGAAVAVDLAARRHPAALVLRSPFSSLAEIGRTHYPFLPVGLLLRDRFDRAHPRRRRPGSGHRRGARRHRAGTLQPHALRRRGGAQALGRDRGRRPQRPGAARGAADDRGDRRVRADGDRGRGYSLTPPPRAMA